MAAWPHGWLALAGAVACEPGGGSQDRAGGPAAVAVPQASLTRRPTSR